MASSAFKKIVPTVVLGVAALVSLSLLFACGFISNSTPASPPPTADPIVEQSVRYWIKATPIVERQRAEVGIPLAKLMTEIGPQVRAGDRSAMTRWVNTLRKVRPQLGESFIALSSLNPPPGLPARWHFAQLEAWGKRLDSTDILLANWCETRNGFTGTIADSELASQLWDAAMLAGQEADKLQIELIQLLASV